MNQKTAPLTARKLPHFYQNAPVFVTSLNSHTTKAKATRTPRLHKTHTVRQPRHLPSPPAGYAARIRIVARIVPVSSIDALRRSVTPWGGLLELSVDLLFAAAAN